MHGTHRPLSVESHHITNKPLTHAPTPPPTTMSDPFTTRKSKIVSADTPRPPPLLSAADGDDTSPRPSPSRQKMREREREREVFVASPVAADGCGARGAGMIKYEPHGTWPPPASASA
jgi:hypothetical protein